MRYGTELRADAIAIMDLARVRAKRGEIEPAIDLLAEARRKIPDDPVLTIAPGTILEHVERFEEAAAALECALESLKTHGRAKGWGPMLQQRVEAMKARVAAKNRAATGKTE